MWLYTRRTALEDCSRPVSPTDHFLLVSHRTQSIMTGATFGLCMVCFQSTFGVCCVTCRNLLQCIGPDPSVRPESYTRTFAPRLTFSYRRKRPQSKTMRIQCPRLPLPTPSLALRMSRQWTSIQTQTWIPNWTRKQMWRQTQTWEQTSR